MKRTPTHFDNADEYRKRARAFKYDAPFLDSVLSQVPENGTFLDVGCGIGVFLEAIAKRAQEIGRTDIKFYGIDPTEKMIEEAKEINKDNGVRLFCGGDISSADDLKRAMEGLGLPSDTKFDYVACQNVLFFFDDDAKPTVLKNLKDMMNPDGVLRVTIREPRDDLPKDGLFKDITLKQLDSMVKEAGFTNFDIRRTEEAVPYGTSQHKYHRIICNARLQEKVAVLTTPAPDAHVKSEAQLSDVAKAERGQGGPG